MEQIFSFSKSYPDMVFINPNKDVLGTLSLESKFKLKPQPYGFSFTMLKIKHINNNNKNIMK